MRPALLVLPTNRSADSKRKLAIKLNCFGVAIAMFVSPGETYNLFFDSIFPNQKLNKFILPPLCLENLMAAKEEKCNMARG